MRESDTEKAISTGRRILGILSNQSPKIASGLEVDGLLFLSGQIATDKDGQLLGPDNCMDQAEQCFKNIADLMRSSGMLMSDVVKLTCYLTRAEDYQSYASVKQRWFPDMSPPGTCVVVSALLVPNAVIEIDAIAIRSN